MTTTTSAETELRIDRPAGIHDALWEQMKIGAHRIVTGHYPWCDDHQDDDQAGWCRTERIAPIGTITVSGGTFTGAPCISIDLAEGLHLSELSMANASCLAANLEHVLREVWISNFDGPHE